MATVRHHVVVDVSADKAWSLLGDPARVVEWFPGIVGCEVDGSTRTVTMATGLSMPEELLTVDPLQRRFQYSVRLPIVQSHVSTIDVLAVDEDRCVCAYAADATPSVMALVIAGAASEGLATAKRLLEAA